MSDIQKDNTDPRLIKMLRQRSPRLLYREISDMLDIPPGSVARTAQQLIQSGIIAGRHHQAGGRQPTRSQLARLQRIARRRSRGSTWQQIADDEGTTRQAVQQITTKYPDHYAQCLLRTEPAPNPDDLEWLQRIAHRRQSGWTWERIAAEDGTTPELVQDFTGQYPQHFAHWLTKNGVDAEVAD